MAELAAREDAHYIYEDYESIQNLTVGLMDGYVIESRIQKLMQEKNLHFTIIKYHNQTDLDTALENGSIDLVAANAHAMHKNWKIVEKFAYAPFYFASWKDNTDFVNRISEAIIQIYIHQPDATNKLNKKYFPVMVDSPFNKEEVSCINKEINYKVYFDTASNPVVWYDAKSKIMSGILIDVCRELEKITGLNFIYFPNNKKPIDIDSASVTSHTLYYGGSPALENNKAITNPVLNQPFKLYHRIDDVYKKGKPYKIAVVKNSGGILKYLQYAYPFCSIEEYDSPETCMFQVYKRKADLAFLNTHTAENVLISESLNGITSVPFTDTTMGIALEFHGDDAETLCKIVNKGVHLLGNKIENDSTLKYTQGTYPKSIFRFFLRA